MDFQTIKNKKHLGSLKWRLVPNGIMPFSVADMEFKVSSSLKEALSEFVKKDHLGYTTFDNQYHKAIQNWFLKRHKFEIKKEWIIPTPGIVFALNTAVKAFTKEGDSIMIITPVYHPFYSTILNNKRKVLKNKLIYKKGKYSINFKDFENKAKKAKALILCSPHNPVGRVWSKDELIKIGEICLKNNVLVISDEIHCDLVMSGYKHRVFSTLSKKFANNSVICTAPSKSFNIAGLQGSNLIIKNKKLKLKFKKELEKSGFHTLNALSYTATKVAYNECEKWLDQALEVIEKNRNFVSKFIKNKISKVKVCKMEGTYLLWLDFRNLGIKQKELNKMLQEKALIYANSGDMFGKDGEGFIRLNIACPLSELKKAMKRLEKVMKKESFIK